MADSTEQDDVNGKLPAADPSAASIDQADSPEVAAGPVDATGEPTEPASEPDAVPDDVSEDQETPAVVEDGDAAGGVAGVDAITEDGSGEAGVEPETADVAGMDEVSDEELRRPPGELKAIVEAMIFASPEPLTPKALQKLLDSEPREDVLQALEELKVDYLRPGGLQLVEVAGGFQIVTRSDLHEWVRRLFHERSSQKLSVQALETLAVIAYRQPITALEITEIRGVSASGVLNTLLERHLIKIVGRKQVVGRPFMYATTKEFLIRFGLKDLSDLPKVEDMAESLGIESSLLVEQTPPEEQLPLSEPDYGAVAAEEPVHAATDPDDGDSDAGDDEPTIN